MSPRPFFSFVSASVFVRCGPLRVVPVVCFHLKSQVSSSVKN